MNRLWNAEVVIVVEMKYLLGGVISVILVLAVITGSIILLQGQGDDGDGDKDPEGSNTDPVDGTNETANQLPAQYAGWTLNITGVVAENVTLTLEELVGLPNQTRSYTLRGGELELVTNTYTGVDILYLIMNVSLNTTEVSYVQFIASDGYAMGFPMSYIQEHPTMMLAYMRNATWMMGESEDDSGPLRLIVPQENPDHFNKQSCLKYIAGIRLL